MARLDIDPTSNSGEGIFLCFDSHEGFDPKMFMFAKSTNALSLISAFLQIGGTIATILGAVGIVEGVPLAVAAFAGFVAWRLERWVSREREKIAQKDRGRLEAEAAELRALIEVTNKDNLRQTIAFAAAL